MPRSRTSRVGRALVALVLLVGCRERAPEVDSAVASLSTPPLAGSAADSEYQQGFLYGRITLVDGASHEGRLRFGGTEEAFWGDYFNGYKDENPWTAYVPPEHLMESAPIEIFGVTILERRRQVDLGRPFVARFGDIVRVEARGRRIHVVLKSGTLFDLDRLNADDLGDGVRVWDARHGVMDIGERRIQSIEFLPTATAGDAPARLHGTVRTSQGDFTGFVQWNRRASVGTDALHGQTTEGALDLRFDTIHSMTRSPDGGASVALLDGRVLKLAAAGEIHPENRGIYVDDSRYGRVLVFWEAFESIDFEPLGSGPAYDDFQPGHPLSGSVSTRDGHRLGGRLIFDLDESETTETLDAPSQGVNYTIPFGRIASIVLPGSEDDADRRVIVTLHSGEELRLEASGDLGEGNAGLLIFADDRERPEYVPWIDVARLDFDRLHSVDPRPIED